MTTIDRKATTKASLIRSLRTNNIKYSSIKTVKKSGKNTTGLYRITMKKK